MKRFKLILVSLVIVLALGSAWATRPCQTCNYSDQYYYAGNGYFSYAGELGYDYYCLQSSGVCTYYKPYPFTQPNLYLPCRSGVYYLIP